MNAVAVVDIDAIVDVPQDKDHACGRVFRLLHDRMQPFRGCLDIVVPLHIFQKVEAELVQPQIHNGDSVCHVLDIDDFFLQTLQLRSAVFEIALLFRVDEVVVTGGSEHGNLHAGLNAAF